MRDVAPLRTRTNDPLRNRCGREKEKRTVGQEKQKEEKEEGYLHL